ncbi:hypothetical protein U1Q18_006522, partial [Sarracenia purpurea var. burkii]
GEKKKEVEKEKEKRSVVTSATISIVPLQPSFIKQPPTLERDFGQFNSRRR